MLGSQKIEYRPCRAGGAAMSQDRVQRRLAAILAADEAGHSRLMGKDEEGTLVAIIPTSDTLAAVPESIS